MKIRTGFVSNSSSSSFVAVGFNIKDLDISEDTLFETIGWNPKETYNNFKHKNIYNFEEYVNDYMREELDVLGFSVLSSGEDGVNDDDYIICEMLADISEDYMPQEAIAFSTLKERFNKIEELRKKLAPNVEMMVYTGTRMC